MKRKERNDKIMEISRYISSDLIRLNVFCRKNENFVD